MTTPPWRALDEIAQAQTAPPTQERGERNRRDRIDLLEREIKQALWTIRYYFESRATGTSDGNRSIRRNIVIVRALRREVDRLNAGRVWYRSDFGRLEPWTSGDPNFARRART